MLLVHVPLVVPYLVMMIKTMSISVVRTAPMVIKVRVMLTLEILWHKAMVNHLVVIMLPVVGGCHEHCLPDRNKGDACEATGLSQR